MYNRRALVLAIALLLGLAPAALGQSRRGELRGAWMGEGYRRDWPAIMGSLRENGFNAIFPNLSIGNIALYPSNALAVLPGAEPGRDELAEAAKAARANGIELHVWRINWALWRTSEELLSELDAAGRLQRNSRGQRGRDDPEVKVDWLCPSNPDNRKLEKEAMLELVRSYDIAGIQFDYMRFPSGDYCFCDGCKERFQQCADIKVERWPDDVLGDGPLAGKWREWRCRLQTSLVQEVSDQAHAIKPDVCVSLAAWPDIAEGRDAYGQDWTSWVREGTLDFVCPMDYTLQGEQLDRWLRAQLGEVRGAAPLYAGLGAFRMKSAWALAEQVEAARSAGADGFVAFAYGSGNVADWLSNLRATVTAADPNPVPHGHPPARFAFSGEAMLPEGGAKVSAGKRLEVEIALGSDPPAAAEEDAAGAAQASAMLDRVMAARSPVTTYERQSTPVPQPGDGEHLSGRIVAETPAGDALAVLGAFDTEYRFERKLGFAAPAGPFRLAIYGSAGSAGRQREFVVRAPLLVGIAPRQPGADDIRAELDRLQATACSAPEAALLAPLAPIAVQVHATGRGGGDWWMRLANGSCEAGAGAVDAPDLTLTLTATDLLAVGRREISARALWEAGRLRVTGDPLLMARLLAILGKG